MSKNLITALLAWLTLATGLFAAPGDWTHYLAYRDNTCNVPVGSEVYGIFSGNLLRYDTDDHSVRLFSPLDGMSAKQVGFMAYAPSVRSLVLVYENGLIDLYSPQDDSFVCLPQLNLGGDGLTPTSLSVVNGEAIVGTQEGVALFDLRRQELRGYYALGSSVAAATLFDGRIYAATASRLLIGERTANLADRNEWQDGPAMKVTGMAPLGTTLYLGVASGSADTRYTAGLWALQQAGDGSTDLRKALSHGYTSFYSDGTHAVFSSTLTVAVFGTASALEPVAEYALTAPHQAVTRSADGTLWASCGTAGLVPYRAAAGTLQEAGGAIGGYGPARDLCYNIHYEGTRLLVAGGRQQTGKDNFEGTAMYLEGDTWHVFEEGDAITAQTGDPYYSAMELVQDPADPAHHFVSSYRTGLYEFRDGQFVRQHSLGNSPLNATYSTPGNRRYVRISGLHYDAAGNLWMANNQTDTLLSVLKPDGTWSRLYVGALEKAPTVFPMLHDSKGRLWVASRRWVSNHVAGLLCLDYNGTIDNPDDDRSRYRTQCLNEDGTSVTLSGGIYALTEDADGSIWVGGASGLFVVERPDEWFDNDFTLLQIKVPRNDGTNYADYLLAGIPVASIEIDGAGRKWVGTLGSGAYLVSPDGTEILHHFTSADSPLLSDNVYDVAVNPSTGEVMFATDLGLCSYAGDATEAAPSLSKGNVRVYPNPVRPDYHGSVTVSGLTAGADIVVTTTGGQAVAQGTSLGGTFTWNCRTSSGRRVASGVYYIMVSTADAKKGVVAKVTVI